MGLAAASPIYPGLTHSFLDQCDHLTVESMRAVQPARAAPLARVLILESG